MYYSNYIELHYYIHCTAMYCGSRIKGRSSLISVASRACMLHGSMYYYVALLLLFYSPSLYSFYRS